MFYRCQVAKNTILSEMRVYFNIRPFWTRFGTLPHFNLLMMWYLNPTDKHRGSYMKAIFLLILMVPLLMNGQSLRIRVMDDQNTPLPYSSVIWNKDLGLVTDSSGYVKVPDISLVDSLVIQSLGYEQKVFYRSEIPAIGNLIVKLKPRIIELSEVIVWKAFDYAEFGVTVKKEGFIFFKHNTCTNFQIAVKISGYKNPAKLDNVSVLISGSSESDLPFRIRIYEMKQDGLPGEDLINENIIVTNYKKGQWNTIDLSEYSFGNLPASGFFVSMELLCDDLSKKNGLCIAGTDEINSRLTYFKNGTSEWKDFSSNNNKRSRPTNYLIKAELGFPGK